MSEKTEPPGAPKLTFIFVFPIFGLLFSLSIESVYHTIKTVRSKQTVSISNAVIY